MMEKQLIRAGYKQTEVGVIPEDWSVELLSSICEKITDGTHDTPKPTTLGVPFLTAIHVKENRIDFESCYYLPKSIHDEIYKRCNPQKNDVLMVNIGAGVATSALVKVEYEFSLKNVALLKPKKQKIIGAYLNFYQSYVKNKVYESLATGGAQPFLSLFQIGQLKISLPRDIEEQTAIANALSDVDALIAALEKLINKKSAIKTAAMQQLLTGKNRLPPFDQLNTGYKQTELGEIPGDWEVKTIGQFAPLQRGFDLPSTQRVDGDYPVVYSNGIVNYHKNFQVKGPGVVTGRSGTLGKVHYVDSNFWPHNTSLWVTAFNGSHPKFVYYLYLRVGLERFASGSGVPTLNRNDAHSFKITVPSLMQEQITIADALSDMDKDLESLQQRLHKTQQVKQGMMQELLTGKTRLLLGNEESQAKEA